MENIKQVYGKNIRTLRKQRGYTLQLLGQRVGISYQQISRIENGSGTSSNTLERIATILGVSPSVLMNEEIQEDLKEPSELCGYKNFVRGKVYEELQDNISDLLFNKTVRLVNDNAIDNFMKDIIEQLNDKDWICQTVRSLTGSPKDRYKFTDTELLNFCKQFTIMCIDQITALAYGTCN